MARFHRRGVLALAVACLAVQPLLAHPGSGIAVDRRGDVYFADTGGGVWKIDTRRRVTKIDGTMFHWLAMDLDGRFARGPMPTSRFGDFVRAGADPTVILSSDFPVTIGADGAFYYPDRGRPDGRVELLRWTAAGARSVLATLPAATETGPLQWINGLAAGRDGAIYYSENAAVRRVTAQGTISTVAANVRVTGCIAVPGAATTDGVFLRGLAVAEDNTVFVAASGCGAVLKISPAGVITPVLRTTAPWSPTAVAVAGSDVYVLEYLHTADENRRAWIPRVRQLRADGSVVLLAAIKRE
jgi:hypothetical protein